MEIINGFVRSFQEVKSVGFIKELKILECSISFEARGSGSSRGKGRTILLFRAILGIRALLWVSWHFSFRGFSFCFVFLGILLYTSCVLELCLSAFFDIHNITYQKNSQSLGNHPKK
jgi:hypothetical protein